MPTVNNIISACRAYHLKHDALAIVLTAVITAVFAVLALNADSIFGAELNIAWMFWVLGAAALLYLVRKVWLDVFAKPGRLNAHISNIPSEERAKVVREFSTATAQHGRYFLSDFVVFFPFDSGIIRYSKVDEVSVYPNSIGISGGGRLFFLKTEKGESPIELADKMREYIPEKPQTEDNGETE